MIIIKATISILYFNPRPRKEGDRGKEKKCLRMDYFNPRPRKEGDSCLLKIANGAEHFNPRPRKEGDQYVHGLPPISMSFQSTPS